MLKAKSFVLSKPSDKSFLFFVLGMTIFGLAILASASSPLGYERFADSYYYLKHQLTLGVLPGIVAMLIFAKIPYQSYRKYATAMLAVSIGLLILVFVPGIGTDFGTFAHSWVQFGSYSFQPAEIAKLTFLIYLAAWLEQRSDDLKTWETGLLPFLAALGIISILMLLQPDLGTLSIIVAIAFIMYFVAGGNVTHLIGLGVMAFGAFIVSIKMSPYRFERFTTFLHPELDPRGIGYQINQALLAIGSGGFFGRGYGHSLQKFQYLPEVVGDSIFAVMSEELGFIFTAAFVILFLLMLLRGIKIAENSTDNFGKYLVIGIIAWFGVQAFVNIGAIVGLMPLTGVPLPFLSYGGTALTVSLAAAGIVMNVSRK
ncbi:putative lipid II flippase FtsW [Candidatus Uhrbacteria bacterium CG_4_10_14_3_um_filter_41_21]|nr:MAG: putative lipid II flippase FtsW [Candidatus Uhrbacteria bacterium CG_4_10_14_3_um_filter_41_21]